LHNGNNRFRQLPKAPLPSRERGVSNAAAMSIQEIVIHAITLPKYPISDWRGSGHVQGQNIKIL
jgi:hypothetical protein